MNPRRRCASLSPRNIVNLAKVQRIRPESRKHGSEGIFVNLSRRINFESMKEKLFKNRLRRAELPSIGGARLANTVHGDGGTLSSIFWFYFRTVSTYTICAGTRSNIDARVSISQLRIILPLVRTVRRCHPFSPVRRTISLSRFVWFHRKTVGETRARARALLRWFQFQAEPSRIIG